MCDLGRRRLRGPSPGRSTSRCPSWKVPCRWSRLRSSLCTRLRSQSWMMRILSSSVRRAGGASRPHSWPRALATQGLETMLGPIRNGWRRWGRQQVAPSHGYLHKGQTTMKLR